MRSLKCVFVFGCLLTATFVCSCSVQPQDKLVQGLSKNKIEIRKLSTNDPRPTIEVFKNGSLSLLVDSGATRSAIRQQHLEGGVDRVTSLSHRTASGFGQNESLPIYRSGLSLGPGRARIPLLVAALPQTRRQTASKSTEGYLGLDFLRRIGAVVSLYDGALLVGYTSDEIGAIARGRGLVPMPLVRDHRSGSLYLASGQKGRGNRWLVDTGATHTLLYNHLGQGDSFGQSGQIRVVDSRGLFRYASRGKIGGLFIGGAQYPPMDALILEGRRLKRESAGVLGIDFFTRHRAMIDAARSVIYLAPPKT